MTHQNSEKTPSETALTQYLLALAQAEVYIANAGLKMDENKTTTKLKDILEITPKDNTITDLVLDQIIITGGTIPVTASIPVDYGSARLGGIGKALRDAKEKAEQELQAKNAEIPSPVNYSSPRLGGIGKALRDAKIKAEQELNAQFAEVKKALAERYEMWQKNLGVAVNNIQEYNNSGDKSTLEKLPVFHEFKQKIFEALVANSSGFTPTLKVTFNLENVVSVGDLLAQQLNDMAQRGYGQAQGHESHIDSRYQALTYVERSGIFGLKRSLHKPQGAYSVPLTKELCSEIIKLG